MPARNYIELVEKTMRVLEVVGEKEAGISLAALSERVGLVKSSVFRILFTLTELGYVKKVDLAGTYAATPKLLGLARSPARRPSLIHLARPHLQELCRRLEESAWLAEWRDGLVIMIDVAEAPHPLQLMLRVGDACPLHASALGKAIAAYMSPGELATALGSGRLETYTPQTTASRRAIQAQLADVRRDGYATNDEETIRGAFAIGAPVFDAAGRTFASISVTAPTARCPASKRRQMIAEVKQASAALSEDLASLRFFSDFEVSATQPRRRYGA
jgi:IclR family acetate operon transcriptional repressor